MGDGGFVRLPYELIDSGRMTVTEMAVYIALLRHRDHTTGKCWPSYATLAQEARVNRRTAIRAIKGLEEQGIVKIYPDAYQANVYEVALFSAFPKPPKGGSKGVDNPPCNPSANPYEGGDTESPYGDRESLGSDTESLGWCQKVTASSDTESPKQEPQTSSTEQAPENELHERAITPDVPSGEHTEFAFTADKPKPATAQQIRYLNDLYIHRMCDVAPQAQVDQWKTFTTEQADEHIARWKRSIPTGEDYPGPEQGEWAYNRLSTIGQDYADNKFLPLDVSA